MYCIEAMLLCKIYDNRNKIIINGFILFDDASRRGGGGGGRAGDANENGSEMAMTMIGLNFKRPSRRKVS